MICELFILDCLIRRDDSGVDRE